MPLVAPVMKNVLPLWGPMSVVESNAYIVAAGSETRIVRDGADWAIDTRIDGK
jgi:hypothetical protein